MDGYNSLIRFLSGRFPAFPAELARDIAGILQQNLSEHIVPVILIDAKIAGGDLIGRMVVDIHQHRRRNTLFPGVIAECFTQGMAADVVAESAAGSGSAYNAVGLMPVQGIFAPCAFKDGIPGSRLFHRHPVYQRILQDRVQNDPGVLSRLLFREFHMCLQLLIGKVIYGVPFHIQDIRDPQRGVQPHQDQQMIPLAYRSIVRIEIF